MLKGNIHLLDHFFKVLCWGVRNMKKYQLVKVTSPSIEFECMGEVIPSTVIEDTKKTPNFAEPVLERRILVSLMRQLQLVGFENYSFILLMLLLLLLLLLCVCAFVQSASAGLTQVVCLSLCLVCLFIYRFTCLSVCLCPSVCKSF